MGSPFLVQWEEWALDTCIALGEEGHGRGQGRGQGRGRGQKDPMESEERVILIIAHH